MRHLPFLQVLANAKDTEDILWQNTAPIYLILRFFDRWLEERSTITADDLDLVALKERIRNAAVLAPEVRHNLLQFVNALAIAPELDPSLAIKHLFEYGESLFSSGQASLAGHIYGTAAEALERTDATNNPWMARACLRYGTVCRLLGDLDEAKTSYARAEMFALQQNDIELALLTRMGNATVLRMQGNLPESEEIFTIIIDEAIAKKLPVSAAKGHHGRASVLHLRGQYDEAMVDLYRSYDFASGDQREMILGDLAACEVSAGYREAARDTHRVLAKTAKSSILRASSLINLIELAVLDDDELSFDRLRLDFGAFIQQHQVPVEYMAHATLYVAKGIERFQGIESALQAYRTAVAYAGNTQIHQIEFEAEKRLSELGA